MGTGMDKEAEGWMGKKTGIDGRVPMETEMDREADDMDKKKEGGGGMRRE